MVAFFVAFLDENFLNHLKHTYLQQKKHVRENTLLQKLCAFRCGFSYNVRFIS